MKRAGLIAATRPAPSAVFETRFFMREV